MTRARIDALHREACDLMRDGRCAEHIDREIELLEAALVQPCVPRAEIFPLHAAPYADGGQQDHA